MAAPAAAPATAPAASRVSSFLRVSSSGPDGLLFLRLATVRTSAPKYAPRRTRAQARRPAAKSAWRSGDRARSPYPLTARAVHRSLPGVGARFRHGRALLRLRLWELAFGGHGKLEWFECAERGRILRGVERQ